MLLPYALIHGSCHDQATPVLHQYYTLSKISWTEVSADQPPDLPVPSRDIRQRAAKGRGHDPKLRGFPWISQLPCSIS
jgi:hypothetical protein